MQLTHLIDEALAKEQEARMGRERSGKFSPSMFGRCYRAQVWNRKNEPQSNPPGVRMLRVFAAGKLFHDFVQNLLPVTGCEVQIEDDHICGYADVVTEDAVYDIKSQHSQAFWWMQKTDYDICVERRPNILQVMTYAVYLKKPLGKLLFVSKDDLTLEEYAFPIERWQGEVIKEIGTLVDYWTSGNLPPPAPRCYGVDKKTGNANECYKYCPWRDTCFNREGVTIPDETAKKR